MLAALAVAVTAACGLEPDDLAPPLPPGAALAYVSQGPGGRFDIFYLSADAQVDSNLTLHAAYDAWPSWSPDGQQLAFATDRDSERADLLERTTAIYLMTLGVPGLSRVTDDTAHQYAQPAWSPIGDRIAVVSNRDSAGLDVYLVNPDGTDLTRLTADSASSAQPAWAPSGLQLAFASDRTGDGEIFVMDTMGTNVTNLTNHAANDVEPAWSPDGSKIAFTSNRENGLYAVWVMNANGTNPVRVSPGGTFECELASWTTDGLRLAMDCDVDIYVVNADGTGLQRITRTSNQQRIELMPRWRP
jgi:TolB protein